VYGLTADGFANEETPTGPVNPYGWSKLMSECMLRDLSQATRLRHVTLRYFNVAGSDPGGRIGHSAPNATILVKIACQHAVGVRPEVSIYGTDYPTPDGTGVRDYIHVEDLADAHLRALDYLRDGGMTTTLNCGYGHGYSVREVLRMVERVHGGPLRIREAPRRAGDLPMLVARAARVRQALNWTPRFDDLETIVRNQLEWELRLKREPGLQKN
jgi:UDP-glucose 4-epimerase